MPSAIHTVVGKFQNIMDYKRPKENALAQKGITLTIDDDITIEDPVTKMSIPHRVSYMEFFDVDTSKLPLEITFKLDINKVTASLREKQKRFLELNHNCIRIAELVNEKLRNFLLRYSETKKVNERDIIYKLDFMNLRDRLSDIVKSDLRFRSLDNLFSSGNRKNFSRTFTHFIEDRNIYTHGHLHIRIHDEAIVITYVDKKYNNQASCIIDEEIIQSFFDTYVFLDDTLQKMGEVLIKSK